MTNSFPSPRVDNERQACDAVARVLERRAKDCRANEWSPEDEKINPKVEYVFDLAGVKYALEHTVVQAFDKQIQTNVDFEAFSKPVVDALAGSLPGPGLYRLTFDTNPSAQMNPRHIDRAREAIIEWVGGGRRDAPRLSGNPDALPASLRS